MITYIKGNALEPVDRPAYIVHCCNDLGKWGAGFTGALRNKWPVCEQDYRTWHRYRNSKNAYPFGLGEVWFTELYMAHGITDIKVCHIIGQEGIATREKPCVVNYAALHAGLAKVAAIARNSGTSLHMPRIGCGLAGGDWAVVEKLIEETCQGLQVYVYDLPMVSP